MASDMTEEMPEIESFTASVARLHRDSLPQSPGRFGFPVTTYMGPLPQDNTWCDTWEEYFKRGMTRMLNLESNVQGPSEELEKLTEQLYQKVIPRLLRPLTVLKSVKPVLIHGDLWYGNCCTDNATGKPIVFDACVFWAHNECKDHLSHTSSLPRSRHRAPFSFYYLHEPLSSLYHCIRAYYSDEIGTWRALRYRFGKSYIKAYQKHFPVSAPEEDHDDRNALYSMYVQSHSMFLSFAVSRHSSRYDVHSSAAYSSSTRFRRE